MELVITRSDASKKKKEKANEATSQTMQNKSKAALTGLGF
jgi:hypothetical protein